MLVLCKEGLRKGLQPAWKTSGSFHGHLLMKMPRAASGSTRKNKALWLEFQLLPVHLVKLPVPSHSQSLQNCLAIACEFKVWHPGHLVGSVSKAYDS